MPPKKAADKSAKKDKGTKEKKEKISKVDHAKSSHADHNIDASIDFEAGVLFNKFDTSKTGVITAEDFRQMWREAKENKPQSHPLHTNDYPLGAYPSNIFNAGTDLSHVSFEAGKIFAKFDKNNDGKLDKTEFENLMRDVPELLKQTAGVDIISGLERVPTSSGLGGNVPVEILSGRLLTHYDETAGIPLPRSSIIQHQSIGHHIVPLVEAYKDRYDRLRAVLTGKLMPKREHLLQIRRQLSNCSIEVAAVRQAIERETKQDAEGILERLRAVESLRQSSITHQKLHVDEELEAIERVVRKVEQANEDSLHNGPSGVLITSAMPGAMPTEMVRAPKAQVMVELIQQFTDIANNIERLAVKPVQVQLDFPTDDFPKEIAERLEVVAKCDKYLHAMTVKDHMLWTSLKEKEKAEELLQDERSLSSEYALEVARWADLAQGLAQEVANLKVIVRS